jgi:hypothetical protein
MDSNDSMIPPGLYPLGIDEARHLVSFVRVARDDYRCVAFHDRRFVTSNATMYSFNLDDLLLFNAGSSSLKNQRPRHYIFHSAFCCSTLLVRYLDLIPGCLVLKEPALLTQVTGMRYPASHKAAEVRAAGEWLNLLRLCLTLYTNITAADEVVVIKGSDVCTSLGKVLLEEDVHARIVYITTDLRTFLLSVLKSERRREFARQRLRIAERNPITSPVLRSLTCKPRHDAEVAVCAWACNRMHANLLRRTGQHRITWLDAEQAVDKPTKTVQLVAAAFELPVDNEEVAKLVSHSSVSSEYSKDSFRTYDRSSRRTELEEIDARFGNEADQGMAWALKMIGSFDIGVESLGSIHARSI